MKNYLTFTIIVILFSHCQPEENKIIENKTITAIDSTPKAEIFVDTFLNNLTRLIGGKDSIINYENNWDEAFIGRFAKMTTKKVNRIKADRLNKMTEWNKVNMKRNNISDSSFVFYPFSGGDFIHVNALFPDASAYFLVAREDIGELPDLYKKDSLYVNTYLSDIDTVLRDIYNKSFFITKNMIEDTKKRTLVNGMLPLILWAAAVTDREVISLQYFIVSDKGELVSLNDKTEKRKPEAVEIRFRITGTDKIQSLTYLSCDISDDGFTKEDRFKKFISRKVPSNVNTFVKSASYLMHYSSFSQIRNLVLDKSKFIIQDDTGIPIKYFNPEIFSIELFGVYEKPVKDFSESVFQQDLKIAYSDSTKYKGKLKFSLGYHYWGNRNQNQMIATRK